MKVIKIIIATLFLLLISCKESTTESNNDNNNETFIEILSLVPEVESILTVNDTIAASLRFAIAEDIQSDFGFSISIKFVSVVEGQTFSIGPQSSVELSERTGTVNLSYPLEQIWLNNNLKHPVSCYFYLHQKLSETSSKVIARTTVIIYTE